jgi:hypothetical protein
MATRKVTLSLDAAAMDYAERAAKAHGVSLSSWLSRAARREAIRTGYRAPAPPQADPAALAVADETEVAVAEKQLRAEG